MTTPTSPPSPASNGGAGVPPASTTPTPSPSPPSAESSRPKSLREAHAHLPWYGLALSMLNLSDCTSLDDCLQLVATESDRLARAAPKEKQDAGWLLASGARVAAWQSQSGAAGPRWPTREELDRITDRPCALMSFDHHALAANSAAMRAAGLRDDSPDPPAGVIVRDQRTTLPTGLFLESAAQRIWSSAPEPTPQQRITQLRAALADLARHGFTEVHDLLSPPWLGPALAALHDVGSLPITVQLFCPFDQLDAAARAAPDWTRPNLRLAGAKLFADGTLNSRTAWMLHPYHDPLPGLPVGKPLLSSTDMALAIHRAAGLNLGIAIHAIGDAATRAALDAAQLTAPLRLSASPSPRHSVTPSLPLRIEHAELIDASDIPRFAALGVIASLQPCHLLADIEALTRFLPHRLNRVLPIRDLIGAGCIPGHTLLFGSDVPVVRPDPIDSITAATLRRRPEAPAWTAIAPDQAIDEPTAWSCFARA